jgi:hypothetical protein
MIIITKTDWKGRLLNAVHENLGGNSEAKISLARNSHLSEGTVPDSSRVFTSYHVNSLEFM